MTILVTGGCGFVGSNLVVEAISRGHSVVVFDNLSRVGSFANLNWIQSVGPIEFVHGDIRNAYDVDAVTRRVRPDVIFHLAGQVAMTTSIQNPRYDFEVNTLGSLNVLEAVKNACPDTLVIYSSTNKVYGDLEYLNYTQSDTRYIADDYPFGFPESLLLDFRSPYGCSKGAADQYMLDYARIFGLRTIVLRHSSMYGSRQYATSDQGWVGWFCQKAIEIKKGSKRGVISISGDGKQVRDLLHADDVAKLYFELITHSDVVCRQVFNLGGGFANSLSLIELLRVLEAKLSISVQIENLPPRESDQRVFVADIQRLTQTLGWSPEVTYDNGIDRMLVWVDQIL